MCGFYCIAFIDYMLAGKPLLDYTNLYYLNGYKKNGKKYISILNYKKNDKIVYKYFKDKYDRRSKSRV